MLWHLLKLSNFELLGSQEIALLSQFEHENIVQYYGTDKVPPLFF